jgi:hypothetical protein
MTPFEKQFEELKRFYPSAQQTPQPTGAVLIEIPDFRVPPGWNRETVTVIFLAPPGYPGAQPDCFWVEPAPVRLSGDRTPQGTNDSNPIPGIGPRGTWFSWHLQSWNPNQDSLLSYAGVIKKRFQNLQ